jgi:hypothetical protein
MYAHPSFPRQQPERRPYSSPEAHRTPTLPTTRNRLEDNKLCELGAPIDRPSLGQLIEGHLKVNLKSHLKILRSASLKDSPAVVARVGLGVATSRHSHGAAYVHSDGDRSDPRLGVPDVRARIVQRQQASQLMGAYQ